ALGPFIARRSFDDGDFVLCGRKVAGGKLLAFVIHGGLDIIRPGSASLTAALAVKAEGSARSRCFLTLLACTHCKRCPEPSGFRSTACAARRAFAAVLPAIGR